MPIDGRTAVSRSRFGLIAFLVLLGAAAAHAQDDSLRNDVDSPGLRIEAAAGWGGAVDTSAPVPVAFLIHNDSDAQITGRLRLTDPFDSRNVLLGEVVVSPGTARRFTTIQALSGWDECYATFSTDGDLRWRRELPLNTGGGFSHNINFALFVDEGGRRLQISEEAPDTSAYNSNTLIAGEDGRPVECLTVKTWQLPSHPGPLIPVQAVIFPEGAGDEDVNDAQWQAVAKWMCQGGAVFLHRDSANIRQRLTAVAPFIPDPPVLEGELMISRAGLGAIYEYDQPLLPSAGGKMRATIGRAVANLARQHIAGILNGTDRHHWRGGRADRNRAYIALFFGCYTLFVGIVPLILFRLSRKRIAGYVVVIVGGASILSGVAGVYLRHSRGDLHWTTVTQVGAGGAVQLGRIEVQSAGGRNTQVAVRGPSADLQFVNSPRSHRYYYGPRPSNPHPPFAWQPDLAPAFEDTYQVNVTMTPWGRRRLQAAAFERTLLPLDFEIDFQPRAPYDDEESAQIREEAEQPETMTLPGPQGQLTLKVTNNLPFALQQAWLVVSIAQSAQGEEDPSLAAAKRIVEAQNALPLQLGSQSESAIAVNQNYALPHIAAGAILEQTFKAELDQVQENYWNQAIHMPDGYIPSPQVGQAGTASAWIIGLLEESPILTVDAQRSDFDPHEQLHLYVQEIRPEDMPTAELFSSIPQPNPDPVDDAAGPSE